MNSSNASIETTPQNSWFADLSLEFSHTPHGSQLTKAKRTGPLSVQKALYPEGRECAHAYILHPPAGIVSGDELRLGIATKAHAHSLITTPGANRFYRAREDRSIGDPLQIQTVNIELDTAATCEHFPLETIVYEGAQARNSVQVHLAEQSRYLGWDISCLGLPSAGQPLITGSYTQLNQIFCAGRMIYHDRIALSPDNCVHQSRAGLQGHNVFGTMLAYASEAAVTDTKAASLVEQLRNRVAQEHAQQHISISRIRQLLVIRYLGDQSEVCKRLFIALWELLRPVYIEKPAVQPRIWHT